MATVGDGRLAPLGGDALSGRRTAAARLPDGWPLAMGLIGFPVLWLVGLGPLVWMVLALPMLANLWMRRSVHAPPGLAPLCLFLAWVLISGTQVDSSGRAISFAYRWSEFAAAGITLVYVYNLDPGRVRTDQVVAWLSTFWAYIVAGGFLALLLGDIALPNPLLPLLPGSIRGDEFVQTLFQPPLAQIHTFLGYPIPRPAAPLPYTNSWGGTFALVVPFVVLAALTARSRRRRRWLRAIALASAIPAVISVNRGMWIGLGVWLLFTAGQRTSPAVRRGIAILLAVVAIGLVGASLTPLADVVQDRLTTPHSNSARLDVAGQTIDRIGRSPFLGYGAPRQFEGAGIRPPLGTQGLLWYVAFSHGLPAVALLGAFFATAFSRARSSLAPVTGLWTRGSLVIFATLIPFYDLTGIPLTLLFVMIGLSMREARSPRGEAPVT